MDEDKTLGELLEMLRNSMPGVEGKCDYKSDWCMAHHKCGECRSQLINLIEHKAESAYNDGFDSGFASADDWYAEHDEELAEHGWVRLPRDAGDVPIRVGDRLSDPLEADWRGGEVKYILLKSDGWAVSDSDPHGCWYEPSMLRHYTPPTVEDVLREFALRVAGKECMTVRSGIVEEYAKRLRLADDAE